MMRERKGPHKSIRVCWKLTADPESTPELRRAIPWCCRVWYLSSAGVAVRGWGNATAQAQGSGFRVQGSGYRVQSSEFWFSGSGCRRDRLVSGP